MGWARLYKWVTGLLLLIWGVLVEQAWGARGTFYRSQWSLGTLVGALIVLGILVGLVLFLIWPSQRD